MKFFSELFIITIFGLCLICKCEGDVKGKEKEVTFPFKGCPSYKLGGKMGYPLTHDTQLTDGSILAFFPLTASHTMLFLYLMLTEVSFKVKIDGTMVTLEKCNRFGKNCLMEANSGVKHPDYIKPFMWNRILVRINTNQLSLYIGSRMVKSMSMVEHQDTDKATWSVVVKDEPGKNYDPNEPDFLYLVQFYCNSFVPRGNTDIPYETTRISDPTDLYETTTKDFFTTNNPYLETTLDTIYETVTPAPHVEASPQPEPHPTEGVGHVGLIVGIVVAVILLSALIIVAYFVIKKKISANANINEQSPLQKEQMAKK